VLSSFPEVLLKARGNWKTGRGLTGTPVSDIDSQGFKLGDQFVPARTVVWAAGVAAFTAGAHPGRATGPR
jgi:NADH dehydrogenase